MPIFNYKNSNFISRESNNNLTNEVERGSEGFDEQHQHVMTALPDLSIIIINAQPYERRSSISLINCKIQCLRSQVGHYTCRSFVYDNINQVCDLFAHVGDQAPARLLRFQTRDYFEPTSAIHCYSLTSVSLTGTSFEHKQIQVPAATMPINLFEFNPPPTNTPNFNWPITDTPIVVKSKNNNTTINNNISKLLNEKTPKNEKLENNEDKEEIMLLELLKPEKEQKEGKENLNRGGGRCSGDQVVHFLRTNGFELFGEDYQKMILPTEEKCIELCSQQENCKSLEYTVASGECVFSPETAVPLGNGQLRQKTGTDYLERVCVDQQLSGDCLHAIYRRFPQMILVGFAETVVDSPNLQQCLDNCLKSQNLYGFRCSSGMFYFEEPKLNCILNTEDRKSQPELFTTETSDLVDYFETDCSGISSQKPSTTTIKPLINLNLTNINEDDDYENREFEGEEDEMKITLGDTLGDNQNEEKIRRRDFVERKAATDRGSLGWTQWTECRASNNQRNIGVQARWRVCTGSRVCGREERQCLLLTTKRFKENKKLGKTQTPTFNDNKIKTKHTITKQTLATIFPFNKTKINTKQTKTRKQQQRGEGIIDSKREIRTKTNYKNKINK
uniref:Apple domain-containing protein n=1 Tax=Meloidogyne hapla TaxID=6305 RepID=A0A1I8BQ11_MELHA